METTDLPTDRRARATAWAVLVLGIGASLFWGVHPWYDPTNDGSMYIATARSLVAGEGYRYLGIPFVIRPPGFACLIAPVLALFGTHFFALNLWVSLWGALGALLFHAVLRPRLGLLLATLVPLVLWFNPGYQRLCNQVMSDVPGWTLLVACLGLAASRRVRAGPGGALLLGLAIGCASLVRSGNLLLVPALVAADGFAWLLGDRARAAARTAAVRGLALALGAALVLAPWSLRNRIQAPPPPVDQTLLYSYSAGMWHEDMGDPRSPRVPLEGVLARVPTQVGKSLATLSTRLQEGDARSWGPVTPAVAWLLIAALLVQAARRRAPAELFCLGTLLVVAVYFGYAGRLLLPVFALGLAALVELLRDGLGRAVGPRGATFGAALVCVLWGASDWNPRARWGEIRELHEAYAESARQVARLLAPEDRLGAYRGWHHAVFLERPVYGFEQACTRQGLAAGCDSILARYGVDRVLLTPLGLPGPVAQEERAFARHVARRFNGPELGVVRVR